MTAAGGKKRTFDDALDEMLELHESDEIIIDASGKEHTASQTKLPSVQESDLFGLIHQGPHTNTFAKMRETEENTVIDAAGKATITKDILSVNFTDYPQNANFRTSTQITLDYIVETVTEAHTKSLDLVIPLSQFMKARNLKDRKHAKNQVSEDVKLIGTMAWIMEKFDNDGDFDKVKTITLCQEATVEENGDIKIMFSLPFFKYLLSLPLMPYPKSLYKINTHKNPSSYYFLRKAAEHKNMNIGKDNENTISVKTLLKATPYIPTIERVRETSRHITDKIIKPFERDMIALRDLGAFSWHYCHTNGEEVDIDELDAIYERGDYDVFESLNVQLDWHDYPDQTARIEKKERDKAAAIKKYSRKKGKSKASGKAQAAAQDLFSLKE